MPLLNFGTSLYKVTGVPENEQEVKFDVYQNYLDNIYIYIKQSYPHISDLVIKTWDVFERTKEVSNLNIDEIYKLLCLGWNSEYLASLNDNTGDLDLLRLINQWKPVQTYYSIYSIGEAMLFAINGNRTNQHKGCQNNLSQYFINKDIAPLNLSFTGYKGNNKTPRTIAPVNFPTGLIIPNALERNGITAIQTIACCLRAEHNHLIDDYKKGKNGKLKYLYNPGNTTILHFLYRLRIKTNYKDAEIFMVDAPDYIIRQFSVNLTRVNKIINLVFEVYLLRRLGKINMFRCIDKFLMVNKNAKFLMSRKKLYEAYCN